MILTGKHLARRNFLRGVGTAIALPFLDAMTPAFGAAARTSSKSPTRMLFAYVPNGIIMKDWTPAAEGALGEFPRVLEPAKHLKDDILVISGLTQNGGRALGDGPGDHARAAASFLTGAHPKKTAGADIFNGVSVDQVAAQRIGAATRFASLEIGLEDGRQVGNCDSGYSCAYSNSISWRTPNTPLPPEINPRNVFERLFGGIDPSESLESRAKRQRYRKSILDGVAEDTQKLKGELGAADNRKLDEYLFAIREIEKRIDMTEKSAGAFEIPQMDLPAGIPVDFVEHARLMFDLQILAMRADLTRVITFMMAREGSNRSYREIGVSEAHHGMTHHKGDPVLIDKIARVNRFHMEQFAWFLTKLKATPDGDGSLLDHSMVMYGSGISDGNRHLHHDLPCLLAGKGAAGFKFGRHVRYPENTPMANLFLTMLDRMGVKSDTLGDGQGQLEGISDV